MTETVGGLSGGFDRSCIGTGLQMAGRFGWGKAALGLSARGMCAGQVRPGGLFAAECKGEENRFEAERRRGKRGGKENAKRNARAFCSLAFRRLLHKPNCDGEPAGEEVGFCVMLCCVSLTKKMQTRNRCTATVCGIVQGRSVFRPTEEDSGNTPEGGPCVGNSSPAHSTGRGPSWGARDCPPGPSIAQYK